MLNDDRAQLRQIHRRGDEIVVERMVAHFPVFHEFLFHERPADGLRHAAVHLSLHRIRVDGVTDVHGEHRVVHRYLAGLDVYGDDRCLRGKGIGVHFHALAVFVGIGFRRIPRTDTREWDLHGKRLGNHGSIRHAFCLVGRVEHEAVIHVEVFLLRAEHLRRYRQKPFAQDIAAVHHGIAEEHGRS